MRDFVKETKGKIATMNLIVSLLIMFFAAWVRIEVLGNTPSAFDFIVAVIKYYLFFHTTHRTIGATSPDEYSAVLRVIINQGNPQNLYGVSNYIIRVILPYGLILFYGLLTCFLLATEKGRKISLDFGIIIKIIVDTVAVILLIILIPSPLSIFGVNFSRTFFKYLNPEVAKEIFSNVGIFKKYKLISSYFPPMNDTFIALFSLFQIWFILSFFSFAIGSVYFLQGYLDIDVNEIGSYFEVLGEQGYFSISLWKRILEYYWKKLFRKLLFTRQFLTLSLLLLMGFVALSLIAYFIVILNMYFSLFSYKVITTTNEIITLSGVYIFIDFILISLGIWLGIFVIFFAARGHYSRYNEMILISLHLTDVILFILVGFVKILSLLFFIAGNIFGFTSITTFFYGVLVYAILDLGMATPLYRMVFHTYLSQDENLKFIKSLAAESIAVGENIITIFGCGRVGRAIIRDIVETIYNIPSIGKKFENGDYEIKISDVDIVFRRIMQSPKSPHPVTYLIDGIVVMERDERLVTYTDRDPRIGRYGLYEIKFSGKLAKYRFYVPAVVEDLSTRYATRFLSERTKVFIYASDDMSPIVPLTKDASVILSEETSRKIKYSNRIGILNVTKGSLFDTIMSVNYNTLLLKLKALYQKYNIESERNLLNLEKKLKYLRERFIHEIIRMNFIPIYFDRELGALIGKLANIHRRNDDENKSLIRYLFLGTTSKLFYAFEEILKENGSIMFSRPTDGLYLVNAFIFGDLSSTPMTSIDIINVASIDTNNTPHSSISPITILREVYPPYILKMITHFTRYKWIDVQFRENGTPIRRNASLYVPTHVGILNYEILYELFNQQLHEIKSIIISYETITKTIDVVSKLTRLILEFARRNNQTSRIPSIIVVTNTIAETNKVESLLRSLDSTLNLLGMSLTFFVIPNQLYRGNKINSIIHSLTEFKRDKVVRRKEISDYDYKRLGQYMIKRSSSQRLSAVNLRCRRLTDDRNSIACRRHCYFSVSNHYFPNIANTLGLHSNNSLLISNIRSGISLFYSDDIFQSCNFNPQEPYNLHVYTIADRGLTFFGCVDDSPFAHTHMLKDIVTYTFDKQKYTSYSPNDTPNNFDKRAFIVACLKDVPGALLIFLSYLLKRYDIFQVQFPAKINLNELLLFPCNTTVNNKTRYMLRAFASIEEKARMIYRPRLSDVLNSLILFGEADSARDSFWISFLNSLTRNSNQWQIYSLTNLQHLNQFPSKQILYLVNKRKIRPICANQRRAHHASQCGEDLCLIYRLRHAINESINHGNIVHAVAEEFQTKIDYLSTFGRCRGLETINYSARREVTSQGSNSLIYLIISSRRR